MDRLDTLDTLKYFYILARGKSFHPANFARPSVSNLSKGPHACPKPSSANAPYGLIEQRAAFVLPFGYVSVPSPRAVHVLGKEFATFGQRRECPSALGAVEVFLVLAT
jgi:hypothetical protein